MHDPSYLFGDTEHLDHLCSKLYIKGFLSEMYDLMMTFLEIQIGHFSSKLFENKMHCPKFMMQWLLSSDREIGHFITILCTIYIGAWLKICDLKLTNLKIQIWSYDLCLKYSSEEAWSEIHDLMLLFWRHVYKTSHNYKMHCFITRRLLGDVWSNVFSRDTDGIVRVFCLCVFFRFVFFYFCFVQ